MSVVSVHDGLGQIHRRRRPEERALRPRVRGIEQHTITIRLRILVDHGRHLLQDALRNLVLLRLKFILGVLRRALQTLLLGLDGLHQGGAGFLVHLVALGVELLLQVLHFGIEILQLTAARFELLLQSFEIARSFIGGYDGLLNVNNADFDATGGGCGGSGGWSGGSGGGTTRRSRPGLGQCRYRQNNSKHGGACERTLH